MTIEINWVEICRTCMEIDGELLPLYDEKAEITENDYAYKLSQISSIEVNKFDGLPSKICDKCAYRTSAFYDFQCLIKESDDKLKEVFNATLVSNYHDETTNDQIDFNLSQNQDCFLKPDEKIRDNNINYNQDSLSLLLESIRDDDVNKSTAKEICNNEIIYDQENNVCNEIENLEIIQNVVNYEELNSIVDNNKNYQLNELELNNFEQNNVESNIEDDLRLVDEFLDENGVSNLNNGSKPQENNCKNNSDDDEDDSLDYFDTEENILGSINDTMTRIKEIKDKDGQVDRYQCTLCLQNYPLLVEILIHIVDMHVPKTGPFYCIICEMDCKDIRELKTHVKTHKGPNPYNCFICNKSYTMKRYLKRHMVCHTDFPRYRCTKCGSRFKVKNELEFHIFSNHSSEKAIYKCNQCNREFKHKGNYKRHLITHLDPNGIELPKFPCKICNRRFLNNRTLMIHMRMHTGEKPYECEICKKSFSQQGNLFLHMKIHTNPGSYKCKICDKSFNQKSTLKDHSMLHSGEKPYVCSVCGTSFTFGAALRRHMWKHKDERPYECDICNAKFVGLYDVKRHMKIHDDGPSFVKKKIKSKIKIDKSNDIALEFVEINDIDRENLNDKNIIFVEQIIFDHDNIVQIDDQENLENDDKNVVDSLLKYTQ